MIKISIAANLISNLIQATREVGVEWEKLSDEKREGIISDWIALISSMKGCDTSLIARELVGKFEGDERLQWAWGQLDVDTQEQQVGLIGEIVRNCKWPD